MPIATMTAMSPILSDSRASRDRSPPLTIVTMPSQRDADAADLTARQRLAEEQQAPQADQQRAGRLHQRRVDRRRVLQAPVEQRVEGGDAGQREQRQHAEVAADDRHSPRERRPDERQQNAGTPASSGSAASATGGMSVHDGASDDRVARPEERGQRQQQVGLVAEPRRRGTSSFCIAAGEEKSGARAACRRASAKRLRPASSSPSPSRRPCRRVCPFRR